MFLRLLMIAGLAACWGTSVTGGPAPQLRAPTCTVDDAWNSSDLARETWRTVVYDGQPVKVSVDDERRAVIVTHLESGQTLAKVSLPVREGQSLYPVVALAVQDGIEVLIHARPKEDMTGSTSSWLVRVGPRGRTMPPIPYPLPAGDAIELIAVGEYRVATVGIDIGDRPRDDPQPSHLVILDAGGSVVRSFTEHDISSIFPIGRTAFAVTSIVANRDMIRVFDLRQRAWVGPARPSERRVIDGITVGDRAVLVGWDTTKPDTRPVEIASLAANGRISPWKPAGFEADIAVFPSHDHASMLLVGQYPEKQASPIGILAVGSDLTIARSPTNLPPTTLAMWGIAVRGAIYVHAWGRAVRFACTP